VGNNHIQPDDYSLETKHHDHLLFNQLLKEQCLRNEIKYFDLIDECCEYINGKIRIKDPFINPNGDHHYYGCQLVRSYAENYNDHTNDSRFKSTYHVFMKKMLDCILS
jgi:hypothetical protein